MSLDSGINTVGAWDVSADGNTFTVPDGAPNGWLGKDVNNVLREVMAATRRLYADMEWLDLDWTAANTHATITRLSTTTFKVVGLNATSWMTAGRRIKLVGSTTDYGFIVSSSFSTDTTVTVTMTGSDVPAALTKSYVHVGRTLGTAAFTSTDAFLTAYRNRITNGSFQVWQRGISSTADSTCAADRWRVSLGSGGAATITRQSHTLGQTLVPGEPAYFLRWDHTSNSSTAPVLEQRLEGVRTLASQAVVVSFYAKASSAINVTGALTQNFGSGGSSEVVASLGTFALTTGFVRYTASVTLASLTGKTIGGSSDDYLALRFSMPTASTYTIDYSDVQIEPGLVATAFERRSFDLDYQDCLRFYAKTFPYATTPAQNAGVGGSLLGKSIGSGYAPYAFQWRYSCPLRAAPTLVVFNPADHNANWHDYGNAMDRVATIDAASETEAVILLTDPGVLPIGVNRIHATADAEL